MKNLKELRIDLDIAYSELDAADTDDLIDAAVYKIKSIEKKIDHIIKMEKRDYEC
jgi:hypothetical protein